MLARLLTDALSATTLVTTGPRGPLSFLRPEAREHPPYGLPHSRPDAPYLIGCCAHRRRLLFGQRVIRLN